jgi:hypothetical protein
MLSMVLLEYPNDFKTQRYNEETELVWQLFIKKKDRIYNEKDVAGVYRSMQKSHQESLLEFN